MKYLKSYRLFESASKSELETHFGITEEEVTDIMQDSLDSFSAECRTEVKLLTGSGSVYNLSGKILPGGVDYFIIWIESEKIFNDISFKEMIPEIDSKLGIYGLEVFYAAPLSNRSLGTNIWVKRIGDESRYIDKVPAVHQVDDCLSPNGIGIGSQNEVIKVPIKVGDTVLGGRFKNKKIVVKKIGKNPKGDITINGKPLLKFRIVKEHIVSLDKRVECENMINDCLQDLKDDGFRIDLSELDADYPEISITKWGDTFSMKSVGKSIIDLDSHLRGTYNVKIQRILYKKEVDYGLEDSMKAPQEVDDGSRHTDIGGINKVSNDSRITRIELLLMSVNDEPYPH